MKKLMIGVLAAASCVLGSSAAMAAYVTDYSGGMLLGSWTQSLTPVVVSFSPASYTEVAVTDGKGAMFGFSSVFWYSAADYGGLLAGDVLLSPINTGGPQSYSSASSEMAPVFLPGVYVEDDGSIVTISVPEPATWAMMIFGLGLVGVAARRRQSVSVTYA